MVRQEDGRRVLRNPQRGKEIEGLVDEDPCVQPVGLLKVPEEPSLGRAGKLGHDPPRHVPGPESSQAHVQLHHPARHLEGKEVRPTASAVGAYGIVATKFVGWSEPGGLRMRGGGRGLSELWATWDVIGIWCPSRRRQFRGHN